MSLFPLGLLSQGGGGGGAPGSFELISTTILGTSATSVTFNITADQQSTYRHLQVRFTELGDSSNYDNLVKMNGSGADVWHYMMGSGASVSGVWNQATGYANIGNGGNTTNVFSPGIIDIIEPFNSTKYKTIKSFNAKNAERVFFGSAAWSITSNITSFTIYPSAGNYLANSRFSLYGVKG